MRDLRKDLQDIAAGPARWLLQRSGRYGINRPVQVKGLEVCGLIGHGFITTRMPSAAAANDME